MNDVARKTGTLEDPLLRTVANVLTLSGGVVEPSGEGSLAVLLPPAVANALGVPEETTLRVSPVTGNAGSVAPEASLEKDKSHVLTYSTETLEKLSSMIRDRGHLVERRTNRLYLKQQGIHASVRAHFSPVNGIGNVKSSHERTISYLICNVQYTAFSDERTEGMVEVAVNEFTGLPVDEIRSILSWADSVPVSTAAVERKPTAQICQALVRTSRRSIGRELQQFQESLQRRLRRDIKRVSEYYGSLIHELEDKIRRKGLQGEERATEMQRVEAIQVELRKKLIDQRERYAVKVAVQCLNAMRLYVDVVVVLFEVQRRERTRELVLIWNPIKKGFENLGCDECGNELWSFRMCDEVPHILCEQCSVCPACSKSVCRACHPKQCPKCHKSY